jgi:hypothetical protein
MSMQWLLAKAPGFQALPEADRAAIFNFTFLWSLFEAQVMGNFARADLICTKVDEWRDAGTLNADQYAPELAYFRERYYVNGALPTSPLSSSRSSTAATPIRAIGS